VSDLALVVVSRMSFARFVASFARSTQNNVMMTLTYVMAVFVTASDALRAPAKDDTGKSRELLI